MQRIMASNIVLCGGTSLLPGLPERLCEELERWLPNGVDIRIIAAPQRDRAAVVGASLLARDASFPDVCASRKMYERDGATGVLAFCDGASGILDENDQASKKGKDHHHHHQQNTQQHVNVLPAIVRSLSTSTDHEAMRVHGVHQRMVNALRRSLDIIVAQAEASKKGDSSSDKLMAKWRAADELRCKSMATTCKGTLNRAKSRITALEEEVVELQKKGFF